MDREFRELGADHRVRFQEIVDYAFAAASGPSSYDGPGATPDRLGRRFGVLEDGELRSVCTHYDFTARVRDGWQPMAGLASVATPPEHRRRGLVTDLVESSLERWRGRYPISTLWPFEHAYYRQFGWAQANTAVEYTCPPGVLAAVRGGAADEGRLRRLHPGEWERLQDVHEAHGADLGLTLRRDGDWWRRRVFRDIVGDERYVYALERGDRVDGYVAYTVEEGGDRLRVADLCFRDRGAYRGLLGFLADHDSQAEEVRFHRPGGDRSLLHMVEEPGRVDCAVTAGPQVRIVDVADALARLPGGGPLRLAVTDEHAPWNDGVFEWGEDGDCRRVGDRDADADATVDVGTLSQLYVGTHSAAEARRLGGLEAPDDVLGRLAERLPPRTVYLREFF